MFLASAPGGLTLCCCRAHNPPVGPRVPSRIELSSAKAFLFLEAFLRRAGAVEWASGVFWPVE